MPMIYLLIFLFLFSKYTINDTDTADSLTNTPSFLEVNEVMYKSNHTGNSTPFKLKHVQLLI